MMECGRNIELFFLLNRLIPDFRTISDFRKDNAKALRNVFRAFMKVCLKLNLYQKELIAIGGSKFRAVNSKQKSSYNADTLKKKLARIDDNIAKYLSEMEEEDHDQQEDSRHTADEIKAAIEHTLDRRDFTTKKVVLRIREDIHKTKERMCLSEHPFGTVKWHHGAHYLLCKGKTKVTGELGLSFLAYNMKRAISMVGVQGLLAAF